MAMNDWNGDGRNDSIDDYFEYNCSHMNSGAGSGGTHSGNMSTISAVLYLIAGLAEEAALYRLLDIDVYDVPVVIVIVLWIVFSFVTVLVVTSAKR